MISLLAFLLECAAVAAMVGTMASFVAWGVSRLLHPLLRNQAPAWRADVAFLLGTVPAVLCIAVVLASAAPSVASALGLAPDHCGSHGHHLHLCLLHSAGLRPLLATIGAFAAAMFLFRTGALLRRGMDTHARIRGLERLGSRRAGNFPLIAVPGAPTVCHAVGIFRRRILVSSELAEAMSPKELQAALAHEEAHLRRRDPAALGVLAIAGLFALPWVARRLHDQFHQDLEEACDAEAARDVADAPLVAAALVKVASLQRRSTGSLTVPAFGQGTFERRVRRLLEPGGTSIAPAHALGLAGVAGALVLLIALTRADQLHHAVETALHLFF
jgi:Zn-dependent protease with chaperone function